MVKLLRQESRVYRKYAVALYATILVCAVLAGVASCFLKNYVASIPTDPGDLFNYTFIVGFVGMLYAVFAGCTAFLWLVAPLISVVRYFKSIFTDEGYLTLVLPYENETIFDAKFLAGGVFFVVSYVVSQIGLTVMDVLTSVGDTSGIDFSSCGVLALLTERDVSGAELIYQWSSLVSGWCVAVFAFALLYLTVTVAGAYLKSARFILTVLMFAAGFILYWLLVLIFTSFIENYVNVDDYRTLLSVTSFMEAVLALLMAAGAYFGGREIMIGKFDLE